ncbi:MULTISPECIES: CAP domain-containing protein [unclassified Streptomyces]|uniref:CAP domain-containing protein n=1 Tax=unclassified Streptomyces TaxID=2593676 RepID=UPI0025548FB8|nr:MULTISPECIES: CAP domain-containing protein [unclassified Streptomyces]WRZ67633.1 CAP domain-containing protein [Streptomyces sp. NBC_01257]WSU61616.1 CAP domain-containing protein [Streptomyces sp. NBC_01104]
MGRHRRSAAAPAAEPYAEGTDGRDQGSRRRKRSRIPVRTGLLGVSAAMAVGAVAVASGLLPGGDNYNVGGGPAADQVRSEAAPDLLTQGGSTTPPPDRASASAQASRGTERAKAPTKSHSPKAGSPSASASPSKTSAPSKSPAKERTKPSASAKAPTAEATKSSSAPVKTSSPASTKASASAPAARKSTAPAAPASTQAAVLALVNQERAKVGCSPVTTSSSLTSLAQNFSDDMAARGFFDHTDPDGKSPWDRAAAAGVSGLGGENIARGQADAEAVMEAWMNSEGHRANILNCDYKTLGVGVHLGAGGPWWTQDFGF